MSKNRNHTSREATKVASSAPSTASAVGEPGSRRLLLLTAWLLAALLSTQALLTLGFQSPWSEPVGPSANEVSPVPEQQKPSDTVSDDWFAVFFTTVPLEENLKPVAGNAGFVEVHHELLTEMLPGGHPSFTISATALTPDAGLAAAGLRIKTVIFVVPLNAELESRTKPCLVNQLVPHAELLQKALADVVGHLDISSARLDYRVIECPITLYPKVEATEPTGPIPGQVHIRYTTPGQHVEQRGLDASQNIAFNSLWGLNALRNSKSALAESAMYWEQYGGTSEFSGLAPDPWSEFQRTVPETTGVTAAQTRATLNDGTTLTLVWRNSALTSLLTVVRDVLLITIGIFGAIVGEQVLLARRKFRRSDWVLAAILAFLQPLVIWMAPITLLAGLLSLASGFLVAVVRFPGTKTTRT